MENTLSKNEIDNILTDPLPVCRHFEKERSYVNSTKNLPLMIYFLDNLNVLIDRMGRTRNQIRSKLKTHMINHDLTELNVRSSFIHLTESEILEVDYDLLHKFLPNKHDYNKVVKVTKENILLVNTPSIRKRLKKIV